MMEQRNFVSGLVSVVVPVFNAERFICTTIDSILAQTYTPIEIIVIDDCSTDGSIELIKEYLHRHKNIFLSKQECNSGVCSSRNKGLELAKGQFVAFLDADDLWKPNKIEKQMELLRAKKGSFSYSAIEMIDCNGKVIKKKRNVKERASYSTLLKNTMIATSSVLVDRNCLGDFRFQDYEAEDYATWLMLLRHCKIAFGINDALTQYRTNNKDSLSARKSKSLRQVWIVQRKQEKINPFCVAINVVLFALNAIKKHFF